MRLVAPRVPPNGKPANEKPRCAGRGYPVGDHEREVRPFIVVRYSALPLFILPPPAFAPPKEAAGPVECFLVASDPVKKHGPWAGAGLRVALILWR